MRTQKLMKACGAHAADARLYVAQTFRGKKSMSDVIH